MSRWPVSRKRKDSDSDWIKSTSDEDLDVLMALGQCGVPWTVETVELVETIKARALRRMRQEQATEEVSVVAHNLTDFRSWLHIRWTQADATARHHLRTLVKALHVPLPEEPMRRTRWPVPETPHATHAASAGRDP